MEQDDVIEAINLVRKYKSETSTIEVKSAALGFPKKCYDTLSSFSNKRGGVIIFGINEEKNYTSENVYDIKDLQKQISSMCNDVMEPKIRAEILPMKFEGKNILAVKIDELPQNKKPCYYKPKGMKGGSYIRVGDSDELMTDYEIYALQSYNDHIIEDRRPNKNATIEDLNKEELVKYIDKVKINRPNFAKNSFEKNLKLCGIIDKADNNIYPTLAGTMVFGEYPQSNYPQLFIACAVIPGMKLGDIGSMGERFTDNKRIEGNIEEMLAETMKFLSRNMKTSIIFDENGKRINKSEYPLEAVREAVSNALIHRDYSVQTENAYIYVYMYKDRIEILNPGALYGPNKIEQLGTDTIMEARNPNIVRILEEKNAVIENRHSGIPTMKREMKKYNLPEPEFYNERGCFKVVFRNSFLNSKQVEKNIENTRYNGGHVNEAIENTGQNGGQQIGGQQISGQQISGQQISGQQIKKKKKNLINEYRKKALKFCFKPRSAKEISNYLHIKSRQYISSNIINPLILEDKLDYTNKNSINARNQKYITKK